MSYIQGENELLSFTVHDQITHLPIYSKYTFKFELYGQDFMPTIDHLKNKAKLFNNFLVRNNSSLDKPFSVKDELTKYFNTMTEDVINYTNKYGYSLHSNYMYVEPPTTYIVLDVLKANQFDLVLYTDNEFRRLQDFIVKNGSNIYSKYNFNFDLYSNDWNVWGSKLLIFTDYIVRSIYLNDLIIGGYGYGFPPTKPVNFTKYFIQLPTLNTFLSDYSVLSIYNDVEKSLNNIDWIEYRKINSDLSILNNVDLLKDHFLTYGQFELRKVSFIYVKNPINDVLDGIVTVSNDGLVCSGFLMDGSASFGSNYIGLYLITCYHLIDGRSNKNFIMGSVIVKNPINNTKTVRVLQFSIIGYEIYADICVGYYDATSVYNKIFNSDVDLNLVSKVTLALDEPIHKGDEITVIGNLQFDNDLTSLVGFIMDNKYAGNFDLKFVLGMPESMQLSILPTPGMSGAPVFKKNDSNNGQLVCIGMINSACGYNNQSTLAINCFLLHTIISNIIANLAIFKSLYGTDVIRYNFLIKDGFPKRWLGIKCSYYHMTRSPANNPIFSNFPYNGGIIIHDVILGFNTVTNKFIYDGLDLAKQNVIKLNTPLVGSNMYNKFINSSKSPLVIKSITMYDNMRNIFSKFSLGNYSNQTPYSIITYKMAQIGTAINDPKYANRSKRLYQSIDIEYYYFTGLGWQLDNDTIGSNTDDWYIDTSDNIGNIFHQHRFDFPAILIPYITFYHDQLVNDSPLNYPHENKTLLDTSAKIEIGSGSSNSAYVVPETIVYNEDGFD